MLNYIIVLLASYYTNNTNDEGIDGETLETAFHQQ